MQGFFVANMPASIVARRSEILAQITKGRFNKWITKKCHHGRGFIREVRAAVDAERNLPAPSCYGDCIPC
jgi:hypothetical protein